MKNITNKKKEEKTKAECMFKNNLSLSVFALNRKDVKLCLEAKLIDF